jgi:hypothetical protein
MHWGRKVIWPILARYLVAFAAGFSWAHLPVAARVLWVVLLLVLVGYDVMGGLRRERQCGSLGREPTGEFRKDRQVRVQPNLADASDAEREE